jgi:hypothetical protein
LTPDVVKEALSEAQLGVSVSLNWSLDAIKEPAFGRKPLVHKVISGKDHTTIPVHGYDDEVEFNTQCSSQWDSLCHFHHQSTATGYNRTSTNLEEIMLRRDEDKNKLTLPTLEHWHARGGMVARGVLIDYRKWADANGISFNVFSDHTITVSDIERVARDQGVHFKHGDILIVRMGFTSALTGVSAEEQLELMSSHRACGVLGNVETAKWIWNMHFCAVAGDMIAFEQLPPKVDGRDGIISDLVLHPYLLAMFGMPIGELWDLDALSRLCAEHGKYSFLLTSVPLNIPMAMGSPPNALAIL